jgi:hypothetical protein
MAKAPAKEKPPDINDQVREQLKGFLRSLWVIVPLILLGYAAYMILFATNPRRELKTVEQTLSAYSNFVGPFTARSGGRPNATVVRDWLSFFDQPSRQFFESNVEGLAFTLFQFNHDDYKNLSAVARREQAMVAVVSRPPLNGISRIREQRQGADGAVEVVGVGTSGDVRVRLVQQGDLWYIADLGGLRTAFEAEIEAQRRFRPQ